MTPEEEKVYIDLLAPIAKKVMDSFTSAMVLRMKVHINLALTNGAEPEDLDQVIKDAFSSGNEMMLETFHRIAELGKAETIAKEQNK